MRMQDWMGAGAAALALAAAVGPAHAGSLLGGYNVIALGDLETNSNLHGSALVYGDFNGNTTLIASPGAVTAENGDALTVFGNASGNLNLQAGRVRIGGTLSGNLNNNAGAGGVFHLGAIAGGSNVNTNGGTKTVGSVDLSDVAHIAAAAHDLQLTLAGMAGTAGATVGTGDGNDLFLDASGVAAGEVAVFNLDAASFGSVSDQLTIDLGAAAYAVVNVTGSTYFDDTHGAVAKLCANFVGLTKEEQDFLASRVMWNFVDADRVEIERQFFGGVLAPKADVWVGADLYGQLVGVDVELRGQMHVPVTEIPPVTTAPTPVAAAPALAGCAALLLRRRRHSADD